jgi:predicted RNA-binding protein Jag
MVTDSSLASEVLVATSEEKCVKKDSRENHPNLVEGLSEALAALDDFDSLLSEATTQIQRDYTARVNDLVKINSHVEAAAARQLIEKAMSSSKIACLLGLKGTLVQAIDLWELASLEDLVSEKSKVLAHIEILNASGNEVAQLVASKIGAVAGQSIPERVIRFTALLLKYYAINLLYLLSEIYTKPAKLMASERLSVLSRFVLSKLVNVLTGNFGELLEALQACIDALNLHLKKAREASDFLMEIESYDNALQTYMLTQLTIEAHVRSRTGTRTAIPEAEVTERIDALMNAHLDEVLRQRL